MSKRPLSSQPASVPPAEQILNATQRQMLTLLMQGLRDKEIAAKMSLAVLAVRQQFQQMFVKLNVSDRLELVFHAAENRLLSPSSRHIRRRSTSGGVA